MDVWVDVDVDVVEELVVMVEIEVVVVFKGVVSLHGVVVVGAGAGLLVVVDGATSMKHVLQGSLQSSAICFLSSVLHMS